MGESGHVQDVPGLPGTLGRDGQWEWSCLEWGSRGCPWISWDSGTRWTVGMELSRVGQSRMSLGFPGLWDGMDSGSLGFLGLCDGMDSGIGALCSGILGTSRDIPGKDC